MGIEPCTLKCMLRHMHELTQSSKYVLIFYIVTTSMCVYIHDMQYTHFNHVYTTLLLHTGNERFIHQCTAESYL